jgi:hypothetical protein
LFTAFDHKLPSSFTRKLVLSLSIVLTLPLLLTPSAHANSTEEETAALTESFFADYETYSDTFRNDIKNKPILIDRGDEYTVYVEPSGATRTVYVDSGKKYVNLCKPTKANGDTVCFLKNNKQKKWSKSIGNSSESNFTFNGVYGIDAIVEYSLATPVIFVSLLLQQETINVDRESISYTNDNGTLSFAMSFTDKKNEKVSVELISSFTPDSFKSEATVTSPTSNKNEIIGDIKVVDRQKIKFPTKKNIAK